ncbi:kinase A anchor protein [Mariannaea sp. PMI_226]|nr:kinase A anchor protein [Mariannaea sp. PMI_226]
MAASFVRPVAPTHFVCIPLVGSQLVSNLSRFKADAMNHMSMDIHPAAIRPPGTLHLTLGVMGLRNDGDLQKASDVLRGLRLKDVLSKARQALPVEQAPEKTPASAAAASDGPEGRLSITLQGLEAMRNPSSTTVLYAPPVDPDGVLYRFCQDIKQTFQEAGLMADENRPLLLHATVVNTIYVRKRGRPRGRDRDGPMTMDANFVIDRYHDYVWVEDMPVDKVTLCKMGARKVEGTDDEVYEVEAEVSF